MKVVSDRVPAGTRKRKGEGEEKREKEGGGGGKERDSLNLFVVPA